MPLYEYQCEPHGHRFEVRHGMNEEPVAVCAECGGPVRRVIHPVGIVFKGSGFYATDSRKSSTATSASESKPAKETTDSGSGDAKPAAKSEPASTT